MASDHQKPANTGIANGITLPRDQSQKHFLSTPKRCGSSTTDRSACMIELILADLKANYHRIGGGISSIKAGNSMSYTVRLPQEERTDIFTYEFDLRGDEIVIMSRKESTES